MPEQDPLAQLRGIHLPEAISTWPPAPGWWILAILALILIAIATYQLTRHIKRNRYRHHALVQLNKLTNSQNNPSKYLSALNYLLKQTLQNASPNNKAGSLSGQQWLVFLDHSGRCNGFSQGAGKILASGPYAANIDELKAADLNALHQLCKQWIKQHRVIGGQL